MLQTPRHPKHSFGSYVCDFWVFLRSPGEPRREKRAFQEAPEIAKSGFDKRKSPGHKSSCRLGASTIFEVWSAPGAPRGAKRTVFLAGVFASLSRTVSFFLLFFKCFFAMGKSSKKRAKAMPKALRGRRNAILWESCWGLGASTSLEVLRLPETTKNAVKTSSGRGLRKTFFLHDF